MACIKNVMPANECQFVKAGKFSHAGGRIFSACRISILSSVLLCATLLSAYADNSVIRIGVLAYKGKEEAVRMWTSTAGHLQSHIPDSRFLIVPLTFDEVDEAVSSNSIDFLIANTSIYVGLEAKYGVTRMATMKNRGFKGAYTAFGGAIFCRAARADIKELSDLKGRTFMAVDETSLGGWQAAWREFLTSGINPYKDFSGLRFSGNHEEVVYAVRDGTADAGTVRTDTLERMADEGKIALTDFHLLNRQQIPDFPFAASTRLYPEWPFAKLKTVPEEMSKRIVIALFHISPEDAAAQDARIEGWTIPLSYQPVHELMRELKIGPYKDYGRITLAGALRQYWYLPVSFTLALLAMSVITLYILRLNKQVVHAKQEADEARNSLEQQVLERTADLKEMNAELEHEIGIRKESEQKLRESEAERESQMLFLQTVIDSVTEPVMVIAPDYRVRLLNRIAREQSVKSEYCYHVWHYADRPCDETELRCPLREVLETGQPFTVTHTHFRNNGDEYITEITASPVFDASGDVAYVIEVCRDITERIEEDLKKKKVEEQLFQKQKEESISILAGGIAHDFNNILMGILGNAELLKMAHPFTRDEALTVEHIISSVDRMADLTRQLLAYAKGGKYQPRLLSIADAVREAINLTHKGKAIGARVVLDLPDGLWPVYADEQQIIQAFVNLFNNAFEVMEAKSGVLTVTASNLKDKPAWTCRLHHEHVSGDYLHIAVSDTGPGIPPDIEQRVFEPFFTTKFLGRGLGLSAVIGIVRNHGGCINFESIVNTGTTFHLFLPRAERKPEAVADRRDDAVRPRGRHVLVIDDEQSILQLLQAALTKYGYQVTVADSGEQAIALVRDLKDAIDAVILDLQLPGMSGKDIFREIKAIRPDIKVIISTGYDRSSALQEISPALPEGFIQKPYRIETLRKALKNILG